MAKDIDVLVTQLTFEHLLKIKPACRYLLIPLRGLLWPVPGVRGVAGSPGVCGVHGVWGPIAPESPNLSKLFTWGFEHCKFAKTFLMEKVAHRFWHLWQGSLLQWILARHNTWVYKVYCWLNQLLIVLCTHCSYLGEHRGQGTLSWEAPRRPCSPPWSRSPISVSHPGDITSSKDHPMVLTGAGEY